MQQSWEEVVTRTCAFLKSGSDTDTLSRLSVGLAFVRLGRVGLPQDVVATGGKCILFRWVPEATLKAMKEKSKEPEAVEPEPEPTTEVLFLCSYEGCGKTFIDAGALRKHSHIHGERQYVCHYDGCGKREIEVKHNEIGIIEKEGQVEISCVEARRTTPLDLEKVGETCWV
ncbi:zinc finger (C2H2 type) family protein [Actinidia rufa]|uniref:Zinc finger (C2H2 type) family protein n=1 Tax=Actinidia rufa TaxID=165716 RepID=A0A7J0EPZ5_9ERIC|nr:zinc finger (C2H2 type) family protein [Actinidia rufa]